jgi:hypothetical protein
MDEIVIPILKARKHRLREFKFIKGSHNPLSSDPSKEARLASALYSLHHIGPAEGRRE